DSPVARGAPGGAPRYLPSRFLMVACGATWVAGSADAGNEEVSGRIDRSECGEGDGGDGQGDLEHGVFLCLRRRRNCRLPMRKATPVVYRRYVAARVFGIADVGLRIVDVAGCRNERTATQMGRSEERPIFPATSGSVAGCRPRKPRFSSADAGGEGMNLRSERGQRAEGDGGDDES